MLAMPHIYISPYEMSHFNYYFNIVFCFKTINITYLQLSLQPCNIYAEYSTTSVKCFNILWYNNKIFTINVNTRGKRKDSLNLL